MDVNGQLQPIILHYGHFDNYVRSYDFTNFKRGHFADYALEEGFYTNKKKHWANVACFEDHQLRQYVKRYTLFDVYGDFEDYVVDEAMVTATANGLGVLAYLKYLKKAPKRVNVPLTTIRHGGATAHVTIRNGLAEIELGHIQKFTKGFVDKIKSHVRQHGAKLDCLNTGPVVNSDLAIKLGLHFRNGTKFFGGTVDLIQGGKSPIFKISFN